MPKLTYAEWAALAVGGMALDPHPESWGLVPVVAIGGAVLYALRRTKGFHKRVSGLVGRMNAAGAPEFAMQLTERLAVPPAGTELLALPAPREERETLEARYQEGPLTVADGLRGLRGLWGDD